LTDLLTGVDVLLTTGAASTLVVDMKDKALLDNSLNLEITSVITSANIDIEDVEILNLDQEGAGSVDMAGVLMTTAGQTSTLNVTGDAALTITALHADVTTIDASSMITGGQVIMTGRSATAASTYTGTDGADTFIKMNKSDVLTGGAGADTLDINYNAILGGIAVDLSSTTNQVESFNGSASSAATIGFENVNLVGYTGSFGSEITAATAGSTIAATTNIDSISGGAGTDVIQFTGGTAVIAGGLLANLGVDVITNFTGGTDELNFSDTSFSDVLIASGQGTLLQIGVGVYANTSALINVANGQIDGIGAVAVTNGAFGIVGSNTAGSTVDLYFFDAAATVGNSIATETGTSAVKIATISIVGAALELGDFVSIA
jgi:hypothetical protein